MPVPKQRHNTARKGRRRAGQVIKLKSIVKVQGAKCSNCEEKIMPHRACPKCGFYKGREVVKITKKVAKNKK
ncbi:MAG: 50S ribosomal protein L32 [uncultured bacterium]|nr:MAG: 50S ribosomal protein L32 [uncultured bacterium]HBR79811.1 50S ribosomal protein L32 [Candidatus Moranbacteria bacterium]